ncbi:MAG: glycosyltransferase [Propionibacteriales bacterium]|nr:glycosyltransferase [Propionibacteriales bacterium]
MAGDDGRPRQHRGAARHRFLRSARRHPGQRAGGLHRSGGPLLRLPGRRAVLAHARFRAGGQEHRGFPRYVGDELPRRGRALHPDPRVPALPPRAGLVSERQDRDHAGVLPVRGQGRRALLPDQHRRGPRAAVGVPRPGEQGAHGAVRRPSRHVQIPRHAHGHRLGAVHVRQQAASALRLGCTAGERRRSRVTEATASGPRSLQLTVFPAGDAAGLLPLYVEGPARPERVLDRRRCLVPAGETASFATYYNAFPAGWWQHSTSITDLELRVSLSAGATVDVFRSDPAGAVFPVASVLAEEPGEVVVPLVLKGFDDGGWLWFELRAGSADVELWSAAWVTPGPDAGAGVWSHTAALGITTFDRTDSCVALLGQIADDQGLRECLDRVYVVDQGGDRLRDHPGLEDVGARLGERLALIEQPNLGGSGGFARSQLEFLDSGSADFLVLLDDDVILEPEAVRRAVVFAAYCDEPTIVGGHMLSSQWPTRLHAMAERVDPRRFWWGPVDDRHRNHDLAERGLRQTPWLHRRVDADYNGWWMCLIPRLVLERVGLALPVFLKWDDAEFGLRARRAGHRTVTLPGAAVWHAAWDDKDDSIGWQAYFHERNRVVAALLHSPHRHGGDLVRDLFLHHVKHLVAMRYSTAALRQRALADVLEGPERLHDVLDTGLSRVRRLRSSYPDADVHPHAGDFPPVRSATGRAARSARGGMWGNAARGVFRQFLPPSREAGARPQVLLRHGEAHWSRLLHYDSAVVELADGAGFAWHRRDRREFARMVRRSATLSARLVREWPRLAERYRAEQAELVSPEGWRQTFERVRRSHGHE